MRALPPDPIAAAPSPSRIRNLPNALTLLRLLLVPVFGWLLLRDGGQDTTSRVAAFVVFVAATATDYLDGALARRRSLVTTFGKIADPIADKALMGMALVGLSMLGELPWWVTIVILVREVGVTLLRFWVIRHGVIAAGRGGKLKTALQAVAISLYLLPLTGPMATLRAWVMAAALVVTVVTGLHYVVKAVRLRRTPISRTAAA
ncbi:MAG TPA: CDP-diacylglycerol--glycerol-3-phosphate 3-phosphatidyltransferase [Actinomycetes bacterium]|nr:CDP-diacylglycerol--glycerol-3-phosphate 3-phosphatidyltransferase [Actinomycetes bacterium]